MRKNNCELIRRQLDELMLNEAYSSTVAEHLRECAECREFQEKQTKLRQIVGSLGTVAAPPDFDFRLRARLANETSAISQFHYWPFARRGFAVAVLLIVFAAGVMLVRNVVNRPAGNDEMAQKDAAPAPLPAKPVESVAPVAQGNPDKNLPAGGVDKRQQIARNERPAPTVFRSKRSVVSMDMSSERAASINGTEPVATSAAFPIDVSLQSFKVSLNDARGNARTISVPPISFGSERIGQSVNQFAPKRAW